MQRKRGGENKKMKDLIQQAAKIDRSLSPKKRREELCDLLLTELQTLKGKDLAPYLSEFAFDIIQPGTRVVLKFPIGAPIFDSAVSESKDNRGEK